MFECKIGVCLSLFRNTAPGWEASPVLEIDFFVAAPGRVGCSEEVFGSDDFAGEEGC